MLVSLFFLPVKIMTLISGTQLLTIDKRLPPEIMSEIFILSTAMVMRNLDGFDFEQDIDVSTSSPLSLTLVCRSWCTISRSTQALWTCLKIYIPYRNIPNVYETYNNGFRIRDNFPFRFRYITILQSHSNRQIL